MPSLYMSQSGESSRKLTDLFLHQLDGVVHVFFGREAAKGETDRAVRQLVVAPECAQHIRRFQTREVQAEPEDTAMSLSAMISDSPSTKVEAYVQVSGDASPMSPFT